MRLSPQVLQELQQFVDAKMGESMGGESEPAPETPAMEVEISTEPAEKPEGMMGAKKCPTCGHDM